MPKLPRNLGPQLGLSIAIFVVLMLVYWFFVGKPRTKVDIGLEYSNLTTALAHKNLLPPVGDDVVLSTLTTMTIDPARLRLPQGGSVGLSELGLGSVITLRAMDATVFRVELKPQFWRELQPGPLRDSLRTIARAPLRTQQSSKSAIKDAQSQGVFSFVTSFGGKSYNVVPVFEEDTCVMLVISEAK